MPGLLSLPFLFFWVILFFGRHELGWRWILGMVLVWFAALAFCVWLASAGYPNYWMVAIQAVLVIVLCFKVFGVHQPRI